MLRLGHKHTDHFGHDFAARDYCRDYRGSIHFCCGLRPVKKSRHVAIFSRVAACNGRQWSRKSRAIIAHENRVQGRGAAKSRATIVAKVVRVFMPLHSQLIWPEGVVVEMFPLKGVFQDYTYD